MFHIFSCEDQSGAATEGTQERQWKTNLITLAGPRKTKSLHTRKDPDEEITQGAGSANRWEAETE